MSKFKTNFENDELFQLRLCSLLRNVEYKDFTEDVNERFEKVYGRLIIFIIVSRSRNLTIIDSINFYVALATPSTLMASK